MLRLCSLAASTDRVMLFHPRLKENLLYAVLLSQQDYFLTELCGCCLTSFINSIYTLWWKEALLIEICYAIKTVFNLVVCLIFVGKGWPTLYTTDLRDHVSLHSGLRHHHHLMLSSLWWCTWKYKVRNVCTCTYTCLCPCSWQGNRQNTFESGALNLQHKVSWEFWISA